jgi:hypothetical protein
MSHNYIDDDIPDNDPTDELPILTDIVVATPRRSPVAGDDDINDEDTGKLRLNLTGTTSSLATLDDRAASLLRDIADRDLRLGTLEKELAGLEARWRKTCADLAERDADVATLSTELASLRNALARHQADAEQQADAATKARADIESRDAEIARLMRELEAARAGAAALEDSARTLERQMAEFEVAQAAAPVAGPADRAGATIAQLREDVAALAQHIENRNAIWRKQLAEAAEQATRIRELELELEQRLERQQTAERRAETEASIAANYRERLIALTRSRPEQAAELPDVDLHDRALKSAHSGVPAEQPGDDPMALQRELARAVELQIGAGDDPTELKRLQELEIAIHELELEMDGGAPTRPVAAVRRPARLTCLTGEDLGPYDLEDDELRIGRGSHCRIRIMTHYVSREHARIGKSEGRWFIEDTGSRNGVFVNSVRVDRQALDDNDLITIGDTQFRYQAVGRSGD